jgi:group I intron endonuclease
MPLLIFIKMNEMKDNNNNVIIVMSYPYADKYKSILYKENKNKSGIYRLNNLITSESYIGSSKSLSKRIGNYYSLTNLKKRVKKESSKIYNSILKYGHSNFSIDILEYSEPDLLIEREQYYIDLLKPEYNILKTAGSSLGFKHSINTKLKMSANRRGENHPLFGKKPSYETRIKIGESLRSNPLIKIRPRIDTDVISNTAYTSRSSGIKIKIKIFDRLGKLVNEFSTMKDAALHYSISMKTMSKILNKDIFHDGFTYEFETRDTRI